MYVKIKLEGKYADNVPKKADHALQIEMPNYINPRVSKCTGISVSFKMRFFHQLFQAESAINQGAMGGLQEEASQAHGALACQKWKQVQVDFLFSGEKC